jgi:alpha-beta hydrolase superfamily lysophospholipase
MGRGLTRRDCANPTLAFRECGEGETLLVLHGSGGSGADWRTLMRALAPLYRVVAPDLAGDFGSLALPSGTVFGLDDEIRALSLLLPACGGKFHLVGHSNGGPVAVGLALADPARVVSLTLIEPMLERDWPTAGAAGPLARHLPVLAERTLLVRGELSPAPVRRQVDALRAYMPSSALAIVPGAAGLSPLTHSAALVAALMQHLHAAFERTMR